MSLLNDDDNFKVVKNTATQITTDLLRMSDADFYELYGATKVEVGINTKVLEALANSGNLNAMMPIYYWFEKILVKASGLNESDTEIIDEELAALTSEVN